MKKKISDKRLEIARRMPPLRKVQNGKCYAAEHDEVLQWVKRQPELMSLLVDRLRSWGCITFDSETQTWRGVDYHGDAVFHGDGSADRNTPGA
ncbi:MULTISPECIES: hypothetical protein [unclassified Candidatus Paralachnospira]|uniref:hypothetical protein n=1 Tax=unclassified Candidatus Paralachnospira TaxID=3099471 RepID=UPI003F927C15